MNSEEEQAIVLGLELDRVQRTARRLRWVTAVILVGTFACLLVFPTLLGWPDAVFGIPIAVLLVVTAGLGGCLASIPTSFIYRRALLRLSMFRQFFADRKAQRIFEEAKSGASYVSRYSLYLRPFNSTGAYKSLDWDAAGEIFVERFLPLGSVLGRFFDLRKHRDANSDDPEPTREFEHALARALEFEAPLIGLGAPMEHRGAGRVLVPDEEWQEAVSVLAQRAETIILAPSERPGTRWEVDHVLDKQMMEKCVVICLPDERFNYSEQGNASDAGGLVSAFKRRGFSLPVTSARSMTYFGPDKEIAASVSLGSFSQFDFQEFFKKVRRIRERQWRIPASAQ